MERYLKRKVSDGDGESSSENASNNISQPNSSSSSPNLNDVTNDLPWEPSDWLRIYDSLPIQSEISREDYRIILNASVSVCRFLLKCGLPQYCHDDWEHSICEGIFLETFKLLEKFHETLQKVTSREAHGINQMACARIQKEIVQCYAKEILKSILDEIGTDVFALLIDNFSDVFDNEEMAVVLRYVDACGLVKERFVGFVHMMKTSDLTLKSLVDTLFGETQVSLKQVRGQGYYVARDRRGEFKSLKELILRDNSSSYYVHCFAHHLELVVVDVAENHDGVGNFFYMLYWMRNVVWTSCKRKDMIREGYKGRVQEAIGKGDNESQCDSHHKTIISLISLFPEVVEVLEYVEEEGDDGLSILRACDVLNYFETFDFVFYLHLMLHILGLTSELSRVLQRKDQGLVEAVSLIKGTKQSLQKFRENGFGPLLENINSFCERHNLKILNMEEAYVTLRNRKTIVTNRHHFEVDAFNRILDMQIKEFDARFNEVSIDLFDNMSALSPRASFSMFDSSKLMKLSKLYPYDFSHTDQLYLERELDIYYETIRQDEKFANLDGIADLARLMVETEKHLSFPYVYRLLKLALVLPVAPATVERLFSTIKLAKSELCNRMGDDYLKDSLFCLVEREVLANVPDEAVLVPNEAVLLHFQNMKQRTEQLSS